MAGYLNVRELLHALSDALADEFERAGVSAEYYDQDSSPLPAYTHALLVRTGLVPGFKVARRVLVRRKDLHAYIERHRSNPTSQARQLIVKTLQSNNYSDARASERPADA